MFVCAKGSIAFGTDSETPWFAVDQETANPASPDGSTSVYVDHLAGWITAMFDAAVETVMFLRIPSSIVKAEPEVLSGP